MVINMTFSRQKLKKKVNKESAWRINIFPTKNRFWRIKFALELFNLDYFKPILVIILKMCKSKNSTLIIFLYQFSIWYNLKNCKKKSRITLIYTMMKSNDGDDVISIKKIKVTSEKYSKYLTSIINGQKL